jgi:hypothetical protein
LLVENKKGGDGDLVGDEEDGKGEAKKLKMGMWDLRVGCGSSPPVDLGF